MPGLLMRYFLLRMAGSIFCRRVFAAHAIFARRSFAFELLLFSQLKLPPFPLISLFSPPRIFAFFFFFFRHAATPFAAL